jgi:hypothetical protein
VLDDSGYTVGLHVQTDEPFPWAKDAEKGELLRSRATAPTAASSRQLWDAHSADEGAATARVGAAPERRRRAISIGPAAGTAARLAATSNTRAAPPMLR